MEYICLDAVEVVHSQNGGPLVFIAEETEAIGLASHFVPDQIDVGHLSIPGKTTTMITTKTTRFIRNVSTVKRCR